MFENLCDLDYGLPESDLLGRIAELERLKSAAAAAQARAAVALDVARRSAEAAAGVHAARRGGERNRPGPKGFTRSRESASGLCEGFGE